MKLRSTLVLSIILHASLVALFVIHPAKKASGEMTYYVDLISLNGGGGGNGGGGSRAASGQGKNGPAAQAALVEEKAGSVKDLTVEKEFKSPLRYPDKEGRKKVEEEKMISVVRKERIAAKSEPTVQGAAGEDGLKTGISSGGGPSGPDGGEGSGGGGGPGGGYFPHAYYIDMLRNRISSSWYNSLVAPGLKGKYVTGVYFIIYRDGEISELRVEKPSGNQSLDLSARRAIENASPFAPLPNDFSSEYLVVHFEFEWEK